MAAMAMGVALAVGTVIGGTTDRSHDAIVPAEPPAVPADVKGTQAAPVAEGQGVPLDRTARAWLGWEAPRTDPSTCLAYWWSGEHMTIRCDDGTEIGS
jgi:hypothetical protein